MRIAKAVIGCISIALGLVVFFAGMLLLLTIIGIPIGFLFGMAGVVFCGGGLALVMNQPMRSPKHYVHEAAVRVHHPV